MERIPSRPKANAILDGLAPEIPRNGVLAMLDLLYGNSNLVGFNTLCLAVVPDFSILRRSSVADLIFDESMLSLRHYVENKGEEPLAGETALFRHSKNPEKSVRKFHKS